MLWKVSEQQMISICSGNRRIRSVGELTPKTIRIGLSRMERVV